MAESKHKEKIILSRQNPENKKSFQHTRTWNEKAGATNGNLLEQFSRN